MAGYFSKTDFTPSTSNTYTVSFWVKINDFSPTSSDVPYLWSISSSSTSGLFFQADTTPNNISFFRSNGGSRYSPTNSMRDTNAWYHVHLKVSSGTGTLYYNGESVKTSITVDAQNYNGGGAGHYIHTYGSGLTDYDNLECVMSHFHFVDGTAYDPTVFGSTDSTTGEWKINTSPSVTYGTNGYFILKDGNTGTDHSGNGNNFTLTGTCTKTEDNPSNVFATWNPLDQKSTGWNMQNGNTRLQGTGGDTWETRRAISTIGASSGKYYAELKMTTAGNDSYPFGVGYDVFELSYSSSMGSNSNFWGYYQPSGGQIYGGGTGSPLQTSLGGGTGDVIGIALDIDNLTLQFYKNGSTMGSQITGLPSGKTWFFASSAYGNTNTFDCNFGNGYFGTTAVSSAGTNASNNGIFEYDVPTGFTALSTKGLNL